MIRGTRPDWRVPHHIRKVIMTEDHRVDVDGTGLVILVPMLGRPHRIEPLLKSITDTVPKADVLFLLSTNDPMRNSPMVLSQVTADRCRHLVLPYQPTGDYATKINTGMSCTKHPLLFTAADDLRFHPNWLEAAINELRPGIGVVGTNDLGSSRVMRGEHATHFLVTREYARRGTIDRPNMIFCPEYPHEYVDDELVETAKKRDAWAMALDSHVEHLHPNWGKAPMDSLYRQQPLRMRRGRMIYIRRKHLWV